MSTGSSSEMTVADGHRSVNDKRGRWSQQEAPRYLSLDREWRLHVKGWVFFEDVLGIKCYYVSFKESPSVKNLLWTRMYGLGSSWLGWGLKPPPEKQEEGSVGVGGRAVRVWWWIGFEVRSSESGWLIGYWTEQPSKWWCLWRWLRLCLDVVFQTLARLFLSSPACHYSDVTFVSQPSLSSHFPLSIAVITIEAIICFTCLSYLCLIWGWTAHKAWWFRFSCYFLLYCDNFFSSSIFLAPFLSHWHAETRNPQSGVCTAWGCKPAGPLCSSHLSCHPRDAYGRFLVPSEALISVPSINSNLCSKVAIKQGQ